MKQLAKMISCLTAKLAALLLAFTCAGTAWGALSGTGTSADPFLIGTLADLQEFRDAVNAGTTYEGQYVKLSADIDLSSVADWTPIGEGTRKGVGNCFAGTFDGNGKTISGLKISSYSKGTDYAVGLFGLVKGGTVKDFAMTAVDIAVGESQYAVGSAVGAVYGSGMVSGVSVTGGSVTGGKGVGGVVGMVTNGGTVSGCSNAATVKALTYNSGGVVGSAYCTTATTAPAVENCSNSGSVSGKTGVGGVVGLSSADITGCSNTASVTGNGTSIGGVIGEQKSYGTVSGNTNSGNVTNNGGGYGTGGIIGWIRYQNDSSYVQCTRVSVLNNTNTGSVSGGNDAGGIVGTVYHTALVSGNTNKAQSLSGTGFAAGIVGNFQIGDGGEPADNTNVITITGNTSETAAANITANCTGNITYDNTTGSNAAIVGNTPSNQDRAIVASVTAGGTTTFHATLSEALTTAATAGVAPTVEVLVGEIDCTGWTPVTINSASKLVTLNGNGVVLKNLSAPLFNKTGSGCKGVVVKNMTVKDANITTSSYAAAFLPYADSTETAYFENCHVVDSTITSTGTYAAGFVAYAAGYNNQNDGPVFTTVTIKDCSVKNSTITGGNSTGSLMGHATGSAWTLVNVDDTEVTGNTIICTDDSNVKAGALFGTVGAAGKESYGQTGGIVVGGDTVVKDNTMTSNGVASEQIFGRIGSSGGALAVTGGTYDGTATYANDSYDSDKGKITISGGSFKTAPSADAVVEGFVVTGTPNSEGYYTLEELFAAQIGETKYKTLPDAFAALSDGDTLTILADGTYTLPGITGKTVTIQAADGVEATFDVTSQTGMNDSKLTFKNIIFDYYPNKNYTGLAHVDTVTYDNCTWNGMVFLYGNVETFNNCTFNQNSSDAYNVWTYGADKVVFNECTFNSAGKSVLVYSEGSDQFNDVTVTKCTFNASAAVEGKAAIEIDTSLTAGATITVDDQTTVSDTFASGNVSGSKVYNNKKGSSGVNNDITVVIAGTTVLEPIFAAQIGTKKYETIAEAVAAASAGETVQVIKAGTYTLPNLPKNITIEGTVEGVVFNHTGSGNIASIPNGATFKNVSFNLGNVDYHGFQHQGGVLAFEGCSFEGKFFSYGNMVFTNCNFHQNTYKEGKGDYHMWVYGPSTVEYTGCTFVNEVAGKFINVYRENSQPNVVKVSACKFINNGTASKAALNVKSTSGNTPLTADVIVDVKDCSTEGAFPTAETSDATGFIDAFIQIDDEKENVSDKVAIAEGTDIVLDENNKITGGIYKVIDTALIASGYAAVPNEDQDTSNNYPLTIGGPYIATVSDSNGVVKGGYSSFAAALAAVQDGETITVLDATGNESGTELTFDRQGDIAFTITGTAPNYRLPIITFADKDGSGGKITVTIKDATLSMDEIDARQNATVNVVDSFIDGKGGNTIVKSYFNGAINISGTSKVYTMQVTTMGYITISDSATLTATWQANVYGNGLISVNPGATFNTAALNLTGQAYSGRDNTDADRVGKPAAVIVDGATLNVGVNAYSSSGADYNYNSTAYGINVGTVDGKSAILDIKNDSTVVLAQGSGSGKFGGKVSFGAGATVNVTDGSSLTVQDRGTAGVTLTNQGTVALDAGSSVTAPEFVSEDGKVTVDMANFDGTLPLTVVTTTGGEAVLGDFEVNNMSDTKIVVDTNGDLSVVAKVYVAQLGNDGQKFETLAEAVAAVQDGETVQLIADVELSATVEIPAEKNVVLDMNGKTVSVEAANVIKNSGTLAIQNGTLAITNAGSGKYYAILSEGDLTANAVTINSTSGGIRVQGAGATGTLTDCNITTETTVTTYAHGVYASDGANVTIKSGTYSYTGPTNQDTVQACDDGTVLTIEGGTFTAALDSQSTQNATPKVLNNNGGGAVVYVKGGTFNGDLGASNGDVLVSGGTFNINGLFSNKLAISGGYFSFEVTDAMCAAGYVPKAEKVTVDAVEYYTVQVAEGFVARNVTKNKAVYASLSEAIAAAENGDEIQVLADCSGSGIIVPQDKFPNGLTVDFGGFTYTVKDDPLAGSTGTKNQAFQLLKGNTITFANGAIVADNDGVKMLIQNYADLTLDGMTLDATQGSNAVGYVLSTNNGTTEIKDSTIVAKEDGVAFDVCSGWGGYQSNDVTVTGNSVITGDVEVSYYGQSGTDPATLTLAGGTHNGAILMAQGAASATVVKTDAYVQTAPAGYAWESDSEGSGTSTLKKDLSKATVTIAAGSYIYNGTQWKPGVASVVWSDGVTTVNPVGDASYTVEYGENVNAGNGTVTITAAAESDYTGSVTGTFTIAPRPLSLYVENKVVFYNGEEQTLTTDDIKSVLGEKEGFVNDADADLLATVMTYSASGTNAGTYRGKSKINMATFAAVMANYEWDGEFEGGYLQIVPKPIQITADGAKKTYDGADLVKNTYVVKTIAADVTPDDYTSSTAFDVEGLGVEGDSVSSVTVTGAQKLAGTSDNVPSAAVILGAENANVTANYDITYVNGTLEVTPRAIQVNAASGTKTYDGTALVKNSAAAATLASGDVLASVTVTGSQTDVGSSKNTASAAVIKNGDGVDVTSCYTITYTEGDLEVTPKSVTVKAADATKVYGAPEPAAFTATVDGLVGSDTLTYSVARATGENVGPYTITPEGAAKQGNYTVTYTTGTFTITARDIANVTVAAIADQTYTGSQITPAVTGVADAGLKAAGTAVTPNDYTVTYGANVAAGTDAGSVTLTGKNNYTGTKTVTFTIKADELELAVAIEGWVAGNTPNAPTLTGNSGNGAVTYTYSAKGADSWSATPPSEAGEYTVKASVAATANYEAGEATADFTVQAAVASVTKSGTVTNYATLAEAVAAAEAGDTVTLLADASVERTTIENGITFDLGGKTLTGRVTVNSGTVTVKNGTIVGRFDAYDSAVVTLDATATVKGDAVVWGTGTYGEAGCKTPTLNVYGTIVNTGDAAISFNGTDKSGAIVNIYDGAVVTSTDEIAIYQPSGNVNVQGGTITGTTAIYTKSGALSVTGGTITGNGAAAEFAHGDNGATATGDAIVVENCSYPNGVPAASITGGKVISANAKPVATYATGDLSAVEGVIPGTSSAKFNKAGAQGVAEGYELAQIPEGQMDAGMWVVAKTVTVTADDAEKNYGENDPASFTWTTDLKVDGASIALTGITVSREQGNDVKEGGYTITPVGDAQQEVAGQLYAVKYATGTFTIKPIDVTVTIVGASNTTDYDGAEHKVEGYTATASSSLYNVTEDFTFSGTATAAQTNAGTANMGLNAEQFENKNTNFGNVTFNVTDGYQTVKPIDVTVTITGANNTAPYDGAAHTVSDYTATASSDLYDVTKDFTFSGNATASQTNVGTANMGLKAEQFTNTNANFGTVTFEVTDGFQTITAIDVTVTIVGANNTTDYDGNEKTVSGYTATASSSLYDVTKDFTFSGTATAAQTNAGTANMGLAAAQFTNTNPNFGTVTFNVTDGYQTVNKINASVTIVGANNTAAYDGTEKSVTGYTATYSTDLYTNSDFTFSGTAEAKRTEAGTTNMGLAASQFANKNTNFETVTFNVTDGYQKIEPIDVTVTIVGNNATAEYDGTEKTVSGYTTTFSTTLYTASDFTFSGKAEAKRTDAGKTEMGLAAGQFANTSANFGTVTFNVTDGYQTITPATVTVKADDKSEIAGNEIPALTATISGLKNGEPESKIAYTIATAATKTSPAGTYDITVAGEAAQGNYTVTFEKGTLTLGGAVASVTKSGTVTNYATLAEAVAAAEAGDTVTLLADASVERTTIENGITFDLGGKTLTGRVTVNSGTVTVKNGTIVGRFDAYDSAVVTLDATATVKGDAVVWGTGTYGEAGCKTPTLNVYGTIVNTGDAAISFNGTDKSGAIVNIYDGAVVTSTDEIAIYQPSGNVNVQGGTITGTTAIYTKSGKLNVTGGTIAGNGTAAVYAHNPSGANATGDAIVVENCGYPNGAPTASVTGGTITSANAKPVATYATTGLETVEGVIPGTSAAKFNKADAQGVAEGYELAQIPEGQEDAGMWVIAKTVTITVEGGQQKIYGEDDPSFDVTVTGLPNGVNAADVIDYTVTREPGENVGMYALTVSGDLQKKIDGQLYAITYVYTTPEEEPIEFEILPMMITITGESAEKDYTGETFKLEGFTIAGVEEGVGNAEATLAAAKAIAAQYLAYEASGSNAGTYVGAFGYQQGKSMMKFVQAMSNFDIYAMDSGTLTIKPKEVWISIKAKAEGGTLSKTYGANDPEFDTVVWGAYDDANGYSNDLSATVKSSLAYQVIRDAGEDVGHYNVRAYGNTVQGNYTVNYLPPADFEIKSAAATITIANATKVYGDADPAFTATVTGVKSGEALTYTIVRDEGATGQNVGTYALTANVTANSNYTVQIEKGTLTITPASATVTADDKTKKFGDADPAFTATVTGLKNNDAASVLSYTFSREAGDEAGKTYTITPSGAETQGNYTVSYVSGTLTIEGAPVTVTAEDKSKVQGNNDPKLTVKVEGTDDADVIALITDGVTAIRENGEEPGEYNIAVFGEIEGYSITYVPGKFTILPAVAKIGDTYYATLDGEDGAITKADDGDTVTLLDNVSLANWLAINKSIVLDLGGKTLTGSAYAIDADVVVENGTVAGRFDAYDSAVVEIAETAAVNGLVVVWGDGTAGAEGCKTPTLNVYGTIVNTGDAAIAFNGTDKSGAIVNIYDGAKVTSTDDIAIYQPSGNVNVSGGTITGATAIYTKSGALSVTGGTITGNGAAADYQFYGNGAYATGDAIVVENCGYPNGAPEASIYGGKIASTNGKPVATYAKEGYDAVADVIPGDSLAMFSNEDAEGVAKGYELVAVEVEVGGAAETWYVIAKTVTVTPDADQTKVYGTDDPAQFAWTAKDAAGNVVTGITLATNTRASGENVGEYTITLTGDAQQTVGEGEDAQLYAVKYETGIFTITKAALTITADGDTKVYDGVALTKDTVKGTGLVEGDSIASTTVTGSQTVVGKSDNVPSAAKIVDQAGADMTGNYEITYANGSLEVTAKSITVTAASDAKAYDTTALVNTGFTNTDLATGDTITATVTGTQTDVGKSENVASAAVIKNATGDDVTASYAITYVNGTLEVTAAKVAVPTAVTGLVYDKTEKTGVAAGTGYTLEGNTGTDAGTYTATAKLAENYVWDDASTDSKSIAWSIAKAAATVTADAKTKVAGNADPELTYTATGLVEGDALDGSLSREAGDAAGTYAITIGTLANPNYDIDYTGANLTIVAAVAQNTTTGECYGTLADAVAKANEGDTVKLLADAEADRTTISKGITLDLGGKTYTGRLTIDNGAVTVQNGMIAGRFDAYDSAVVTLAATATVNGQAVVWGDGTAGEAGCKTPTLNVYGTIVNTGKAAITFNGTDKSGAIVNVYDGATVTSTDEVAIYQPSGNVTISGGTITGATGIYTKSGSLAVSGGTISATGAAADYVFNGNGANSTGDALVIDTCGYPNGAPTVSVTGGTFKSANGESVASYAKDDTFTAAGNFVTGGEFSKTVDPALVAKGSLCTTTLKNDNGNYYIVDAVKVTFDANGGTIADAATTTVDVPKGEAVSAPETDPVREDYAFTGWNKADAAYDFTAVVNEAVTLTAQWGHYVAKVEANGETAYFGSLAEAFASVTDGTATTITLLEDASGNGISVPSGRNITVDFGTYTYTVDSDPLAGSTGTETQAFQLLKDSTIVFRNGTITSTTAKMLIQNYSNLTLDRMTLDGTRLVGEKPYTLSTNNGATTINGTTINAKEGGWAFDVCSFGSYTGNSVTVTGASKINGNVEVSSSNVPANGLAFNLESGTMTGQIVNGGLAEGTALTGKKTNDAFAQTAPDGYVWVDNNNGTSDLKKLYNVKFVNFDDTEIATVQLPDGAAATDVQAKAPTGFEIPAGYTFTSWTPAWAAIDGADQTYKAAYTMGSFVYPVGDGGVLIDPDWVKTNVKVDVSAAQPGSQEYAAAVTALSAKAANGIPYWQNYVLGLTGAETEKLTIYGAAPETVEKTGAPTGSYVIFGTLAVSDGWTAEDMKLGTANAKPGYTVKASYKLMVRNANGTLTDVNGFTPVAVTTAEPELVVPMDSVANKTLALVIQITVDKAE